MGVDQRVKDGWYCKIKSKEYCYHPQPNWNEKTHEIFEFGRKRAELWWINRVRGNKCKGS